MFNNPITLIEPIIDLAREASQKILEVYKSDFDINKKHDSTPVTTADLAAHHCIVDGLKEITPSLPILSEESASIPFSERKKWQTYWLVDPLDGTREFIKKNGEFTVNIALIDDHQPILGVIYVPVSNVCYYGCKSQGAFKLENNVSKAINVNKKRSGKIIIASSRSHAKHSLDQFIQKIGEHELILLGSSLKSCLVAEGKADIYPRLGLTSEWDTAAAQCIVEEAGGFITDINLNKLRYNTKESLLNPDFLVFGDKTVDWKNYITRASL